eukprot:11735812-Ditylum_brightwellii.AAC.1
MSVELSSKIISWVFYLPQQLQRPRASKQVPTRSTLATGQDGLSLLYNWDLRTKEVQRGDFHQEVTGCVQ